LGLTEQEDDYTLGGMPCPLSIEYGGAVCHVVARGDQGRPVFADNRDRRLWLDTLAESCQKTGWRIHAYVTGNHYNLYEAYMEGQALELTIKAQRRELGKEWKQLRRGWYVGGESFGGRLGGWLEQAVVGRQQGSHSGPARQAHEARAAEAWPERGMKALGMSSADLQRQTQRSGGKGGVGMVVEAADDGVAGVDSGAVGDGAQEAGGGADEAPAQPEAGPISEGTGEVRGWRWREMRIINNKN